MKRIIAFSLSIMCAVGNLNAAEFTYAAAEENVDVVLEEEIDINLLENEEEEETEEETEEYIEEENDSQSSQEQHEEPEGDIDTGVLDTDILNEEDVFDDEVDLEESAELAVVESWEQLQSALSNEEVREIRLNANLTKPTGTSNGHLPAVNRSLKIDGNGHTITMTSGSTNSKNYSFKLGALTGGETTAVFEITDLKYLSTIGRDYGLIAQSADGITGWTVRANNISTGTSTTYMAGLMNAPDTDLELSGDISLEKRATSGVTGITARNIIFKENVFFHTFDTTQSPNGTLVNAVNDVIFEDHANFKGDKSGSADLIYAARNVVFGNHVNFTANESGSGSIIVAGQDVVFGNDIVFEAQEEGNGNVVTAGNEIRVNKNNTFNISESGYGCVFEAKHIEIMENAELSGITASDRDGVFTADTMVVGSSARVETEYTASLYSTSANTIKNYKQIVYNVKDLRLENSSEIKSVTHGMIFDVQGDSFIVKSGAVAEFESYGAKAAAVIHMESDGIVRIDGGTLKIRNREGISSDNNYAAGGIYGNIKEFTVTNGTVDMIINGWGFKSASSCSVAISDDSNVKIYSDNGMAMGLYQATGVESGSSTYSNDNHVVIKGGGTVVDLIAGDKGASAKHAAMYLRGKGVTLDVLEGAKLDIYADSDVEISEGGDEDDDDEDAENNNTKANNNSALQIQGPDAVFAVSGKSQVNLRAAKSNKYTSPVLRFRYIGEMTLDINDAELNIISDGGKASGIRLYGTNNQINVKNGGKLYVHNPGDGVQRAGSTGSNNMGIHYAKGASSGTNVFNIEGENSTVEVISDYGPAIFVSGNQATEIKAGKGTIFEAVGNTPNSTKALNGIFNTTKELNITLDEPKYFDFKNKNTHEPAINASYNTSSRPNSFYAAETTFALWATNIDWNLNPTMTLGKVAVLKMSGANYANIIEIDERASEILNSSTYSNILGFSRISSNNARPVVDELRIGTDADQYIYGHVSIPEGRDLIDRNAWDDEVYVVAEVWENNQSVYGQLIGTTKTINVYGLDGERAGIFEIELPDGEYLKEGQEVRVVAAWRGDSAENLEEAQNNFYNIFSNADDLAAGSVKVQHVVPPKALTINDLDESILVESEEEMVLNIRSKSIKGTSREVGAHIYVYHNGTLISDGNDIVGQDYRWEVSLNADLDMQPGDKVSVALFDERTAADLEVSDWEYLSARTMKNGKNENPSEEVEFHNTTFSGRLEIGVDYDGDIQIIAPETLDFGKKGISPFARNYKVQNIGVGQLGVHDIGTNKSDWDLYLQLDQRLTHVEENIILDNALRYVKDGQEMILTESDSILIESGPNEAGQDFYDLYQEQSWYKSGGNGLFLHIPAGDGDVGAYEGGVTWSLRNTPDSDFQQ